MLRLLFASFGVCLGACTWFLDTDDARRGRPENAPSVVVDPASPSTSDDLIAHVTEPSVSSEGPVTYRFAWRCSPGCGTVEGSTVPAASTSKGQTWTVEVTPTYGALEGPTATASVTVLNSPPRLGSAGFERYDVWDDEVVRVFLDSPSDADGDVVEARYAWTIDGVPQPDTIDRLALASRPLNVGARVEAVVTISDGEVDGPAFHIGPAIARGEHGFRPLEPNKTMRQVPLVLFADPLHQRVLRFFDGAVWELRPSGPLAGWARLNIHAGVPALYGATVLYDAARARFLIFGGIDYTDGTPEASDVLYELAVPHRGGETFRVIPKHGTWPSARAFAAGVVDGAHDRGLVYGGSVIVPPGVTWSGAKRDLWSLDLTRADPTFEAVGSDLSPGELIGATWVIDDASASAYLVGGMYPTPTPTTTGNVHRLDLETLAFDPVVVATLPTARWGATMLPLPGARAALLLAGATPSLTRPGDEAYRFDFETRAFTVVPLERELAVSALVAAYFRADGRLSLTTNGRLDGGATSYAIGLENGDVDVVYEVGTTTLDVIVGGTYIVEEAATGRPVVLFGSRGGENRSTVVRAFAWEDDRFVPTPSLADEAVARSDAMPVIGENGRHAYLFGGVSIDADGYRTERFDLNRVEGAPATWQLSHAPPAPRPELFPSVMHGVAWTGVCAGAGPAFFDEGSSNIWNWTGVTYARATESEVGPATRVGGMYVGLDAGAGPRALLFGGRIGGVASNDVWLVDLCHASSPPFEERFVAPELDGEIPVPRASGSLTALMPLTGGASTRALLFGGWTTPNDTTSTLASMDLVALDADDHVTWTSLPVASGEDVPPPRADHVAFWDRAGQRLVITGGVGAPSLIFGPGGSGNTYFADVWEYRLPP